MLIENGVVNQKLIELIECTIQLSLEDKSPKAINKLLQEEWLKTKAEDGGLRCNIGGRPPDEKELGLIQQLEIWNEIKPQNQDYVAIVFLGGTMKAMARRLAFLSRNRPRNSPPMYILGGQRPLIQNLEGKQMVSSITEETGWKMKGSWENVVPEAWPKTETEVAEFLILHSDNDYPSVDSLQIQFVDSKRKEDGSLPNTYDTAVDLFQSFKKKDLENRFLVVSSQPFCQNQLLTIQRAAVATGFNKSKFDVCGPAVASNFPLAKILDTIAKQFWEEYKEFETCHIFL